MARLLQKSALMKSVFLFTLVVGGLVGCGSDTAGSVHPDAAVSVCGGGCGDGCAAGERCFGGASMAALYNYASRCARTCTTSSDCPAGTICLGHLAGEGSAAPVCLPPAPPPASCGAVDCFSPIGSDCDDVNTLARPAGDWCGQERVACAHGCAADAGDGGVVAHCNP